MSKPFPKPWEPSPVSGSTVPYDDMLDEPIPAPRPVPSPAPLPVPEAPRPVPTPLPVPSVEKPKPKVRFARYAGGPKRSVNAIRTRYNGYIFRSKLEACWAIFFDAAGIRYVYEQEGYEQEWTGQKYLPDFYLPDLDFHVEVKPERPGYEREILRTKDYIVWGGPIKRLLILTDIPPKTDDGGLWHFPCYVYNASYPSHEHEEVSAKWFFFWDLDECGVLGNVSSARYIPPAITERNLERQEFSIAPVSDRKLKIAGKEIDWSGLDEVCGDGYNYRANKLTFKALEIAREVQFDHGQTPTRDEVQRRVYDEKGA